MLGAIRMLDVTKLSGRFSPRGIDHRSGARSRVERSPDRARGTFLALVCCCVIWACTSDGTTEAAERGNLEQIKVKADGVERSYLLYTPAGLDESAESPLILLFHGGH